jgi:mannose-6-phosphate isomerase
MSYLAEGKFEGQSLKKVFENNRNLFGDYQGEYPLLTKIITANDYLSVQVHPDDKYALSKHNQLGKPES